MKLIPLSRGLFCKVDDADYEFLMQWKWYAQPATGGGYYATRNLVIGSKRRTLHLHRLLVGSVEGLQVDHINRDKLDNQRGNLRLATPSQNQANRKVRSSVTSGFKGVHKFKNGRGFMAQITIARAHKCLGYFSHPEDAARAYDRAATTAHGAFAFLNFPLDAPL